LPAQLGNWVNETAEATQTPPDLAALLALAICAAALARKVVVEIRDGWSEPLNLFTLVALPSGERKTAVFQQALAPVLLVEKALNTQLAPTIAEAQSAHRVLEGMLKSAETRASKGDVTAAQEANQLAKE